MAKLKVKKNGTEILQLELVSGNQYLAGRGEDCDIVLDKEKGISRKHMRIFEEDGAWRVELLSRYGALLWEDQPVEFIDLGGSCHFSAPPYDFEFMASERVRQVFEEEQIGSLTGSQSEETSSHRGEIVGDGEVTSAGVSDFVPYLRITLADGSKETLQLEGHLWTAGRDPSCEIYIQAEHISRRHFDLTQSPDGFSIIDLGSANGTMVNGHLVPAHEPTPIQSGDSIRIMDVSIEFEVRDAQFDKKLQSAIVPDDIQIEELGPESESGQASPLMIPQPTDNRAQQPVLLPDFLIPQGAGPDYQPELITESDPLNPEGPKNFWNRLDRKQKVRLGIIACIPLLLYGLLSDPQKSTDLPPGDGTPGFESLSEESQRLVMDLYRLAQRQYQDLDYELCVVELRKLHEVVPHYQESRLLEKNCQAGWDMQIAEQRRREELETLRRINTQVQSIVDECSSQVNDQTTPEQIRSCLREAIDLSPSHEGVLALLEQVEIRQQEREAQRESEARSRERFQAGQRILRSARQSRDQGQLSQAISQYRRFLDGGFPDHNNSQPQARRELASIQEQLSTQTSQLLNRCQEHARSEEFRNAILTCRQVIELTPENSQAQRLINDSMNALRQKMQPIYQRSIIEEDIGNVEAAKEMWQQIRAESLPGEDYYNRATQKLRAYRLVFE